MKSQPPVNHSKYHPGELIKYDLVGGPYDRKNIVTEGQFTIFLQRDKQTSLPKVVKSGKGPIEKDVYSLDICPDGYLRYFYEGSE